MGQSRVVDPSAAPSGRKRRTSAAPRRPGRSSPRTAPSLAPAGCRSPNAESRLPAGRAANRAARAKSPTLSAWPRIEKLGVCRSSQPLELHAAEAVAGQHALQPPHAGRCARGSVIGTGTSRQIHVAQREACWRRGSEADRKSRSRRSRRRLPADDRRSGAAATASPRSKCRPGRRVARSVGRRTVTRRTCRLPEQVPSNRSSTRTAPPRRAATRPAVLRPPARRSRDRESGCPFPPPIGRSEC